MIPFRRFLILVTLFAIFIGAGFQFHGLAQKQKPAFDSRITAVLAASRSGRFRQDDEPAIQRRTAA